MSEPHFIVRVAGDVVTVEAIAELDDRDQEVLATMEAAMAAVPGITRATDF